MNGKNPLLFGLLWLFLAYFGDEAAAGELEGEGVAEGDLLGRPEDALPGNAALE